MNNGQPPPPEPPPLTPAQAALRDAYLAELWPTTRELPRHVRETKRKDDRRKQREMEDRELGIHIPPDVPVHSPESTEMSTGCAETASEKGQAGGTKCA